MANSSRAPVKFERPPVVEVVFSLTFKLASALKQAHVGLFWSAIRHNYPNTEDAAPIPQMQEQEPGMDPTVELTIAQLPPTRRTWFLTEDGRHLIQLQEDRFIYNWKRVTDEDNYPSYEKVLAGFKFEYGRFLTFLKTENLGEPAVIQLELTYVNHIPASPDTPAPTAILVDHTRCEATDRFLPEPEGFTWATGYRLPGAAGRLHMKAQTAKLSTTGQPVLRLDITARGMPPDTSTEGCESWFELAHEWITQGFADATASQLHDKVWRRQL